MQQKPPKYKRQISDSAVMEPIFSARRCLQFIQRYKSFKGKHYRRQYCVAERSECGNRVVTIMLTKKNALQLNKQEVVI